MEKLARIASERLGELPEIYRKQPILHHQPLQRLRHKHDSEMAARDSRDIGSCHDRSSSG